MSGSLAYLPDGTIVGRPTSLAPETSAYLEALTWSAHSDAARAEAAAQGTGGVVFPPLVATPGDIWATFALPFSLAVLDLEFVGNCRPNTAGAELVMQGSVDGNATWMGGASDYRSVGTSNGALALSNFQGNAGYLSPLQAHNSGGLTGRVTFDPRRTSTARPRATAVMSGDIAGGNGAPFVSVYGTSMPNAGAPLTGVRFAWVGQTWGQGTIILRGLKA